MKVLNFSKRFDKLSMRYGEQITTIRGKTFSKRNDLNIGDEVEIKIKGNKVREGQIKNITNCKIREISYKTLKWDISPEKFDMVQDFVNLLNKLWRYQEVTQDTEVSVIELVLTDHPSYDAINWEGLTDLQKQETLDQILDILRETDFRISKFTRDGYCLECREKLTGRKTYFCNDECGNAFWRRFYWLRIRYDVWERDNGHCQKCNIQVYRETSDTDHIIRIADGGAIFSMANYQLLCIKCHRAKSSEEMIKQCKVEREANKHHSLQNEIERMTSQGQTFLDDFLKPVKEGIRWSF
jgi:hypothetical protein